MTPGDMLTPPSVRGPAPAIGNPTHLGEGGGAAIRGGADRWHGVVEVRRGRDAMMYGSFELRGVASDRSYRAISGDTLLAEATVTAPGILTIGWTARRNWVAGIVETIGYDSE